MKEQGQSMTSRPFVGIKSQPENIKLFESVWIGILDLDKKKVDHCLQVDLADNELKTLKDIKFCKSKIIDNDTD